MRKRLFREHQAKDCQEIKELRRICCEESDRARQARIDELSVHQERNPTTASQLLARIQDLKNRVNSMSDAREFNEPETANSTREPTFPVTPQLFRVPEPCFAAIFDCRMIHGKLWVLQETFLNDHLLEKDKTSTIFDNLKNLVYLSVKSGPDFEGHTKRPEIEMR